MLPSSMQRDLEGIFRARFSTDLQHRKKLSTEWSQLSPAFRDLADRCVADGVVAPLDIDEVRLVLKLAREYKVPLIPRGAGTGNNIGAVLPLRGGIIVDMRGMNQILTTDGENVIVESGCKFLDLMKNVRRRGLDLRMYPTSFLVSTLGGFTAGGSRGIGSYEYGLIWENVSSVELLKPTGELTELAGKDLDVATHALGTTGIITKVGVMLRKDVRHHCEIASFKRLGDVAGAASELAGRQLPFWHMVARNPELSGMVSATADAKVPGWTLIVAYPQDRPLGGEIAGVVRDHNGTLTELEAGDAFRRDQLLSGIFSMPTTPKILREMRIKDPNKYLIYVVRYFEPPEIWAAVQSLLSSPLGALMLVEVSYYRVTGRLMGHVGVFVKGESPTLAQVKSHIESLGGLRFDLHSLYINDRLASIAPEKLSRILEMKKKIDPDDLMNPGKIRLEPAAPETKAIA